MRRAGALTPDSLEFKQQPSFRCRRCRTRQIAAHAEYVRCIGLLWTRFTKRVAGHLCGSCHDQLFWRYLFANLAFGWWSVSSWWINPFIVAHNIQQYRQARRRLREFEAAF
jgi:hypothetical protein